MVSPIDPTNVMNEQTILQDCVVETIDPDTASRRLIWSVQLLEGKVAGLGVVLRAHARLIASRIKMPDGVVTYYSNKQGQYYADLNAIELSIGTSNSTKARLAPRYDIIMSPRGTGIGRVLRAYPSRPIEREIAN